MVHHPYVLDFLHEGRLCPMRILLRLPCLKFIFLLHGEKCAECDLGVPIRVSNTEASSCPGMPKIQAASDTFRGWAFRLMAHGTR